MKKRKIIAISISLIYLLISLVVDLLSNQPLLFIRTILFISFSLLFIIFNEEMSRYQGFLGGFKKITAISPPEIIEFLGWLILLFPVWGYFFLEISFF